MDAHKVCPALRSLIKLLIDSLFSHILFSKVLFCSPKEILKNNRTFACNHALLCSVILKQSAVPISLKCILTRTKLFCVVYIPRKCKRLVKGIPYTYSSVIKRSLSTCCLKKNMFSFCELRVLRLLGTNNLSCKIVKNRILSEVYVSLP